MTALTSRFPIKGLNCASCVRRAEAALSTLQGVAGVQVNLATASAEVRHDARLVDVVSAVRGAGFEVPQADVMFAVSNANCGSCVGKIERKLTAQPGVLSVVMNLASGQLRATVLPGTDPAALAAVLGDAGYPARVLEAGKAPARQDETTGLRRDLIFAAAFTLPVFIAEMGGHLFPAFHMALVGAFGPKTLHLLQFALIAVVLFGPGWRFFAKGMPLLLRRSPDMNALVALGASAAWGYSTLVTFVPSLFPADARFVYFEAAGVIVTLILLGRFLEARAKGRAGAAIQALMDLRPDVATVVTDSGPLERPIAQVMAGDILQLRPGERVAVDGEVIDGHSHIDESLLTGEAMPVSKSVGDAVTGGTINGQGALKFRATAVGRETVLARIITMVEDAQAAKLPIQALVDRITGWFVPAVMGLAVLTALIWLIVGPAPVLTHALVAGVSVLIIACPCAMGLATPMSIMVGTGRGAELGVLFRKGDALQALHGVRHVAFDKTGTLTEGQPAVVCVELSDGMTRETVLRHVAGVETLSDHPLARALTEACPTKPPAATAFQNLPGRGVKATVEGRHVMIGSARLMDEAGIDITADRAFAARAAARGETPVYVAIDGVRAALITIADPIKPDARQAISQLRDMGVTPVMITGDTQATANAIASDIGITQVVAGVLPDGKRDAVAKLQAQGPLAFVGDGINDAPALAAADVGLAIGQGTDVAIEAADVVLRSGNPMAVVAAIRLGRATMANIRQNLFWAFGYNVVLIPVAAGVLYPIWGIQLSPMLAAGAMALSSVFVVTNALRLKRAGKG